MRLHVPSWIRGCAALSLLAGCTDAPTARPEHSASAAAAPVSVIALQQGATQDPTAHAAQFRWLEPVGTGGNATGQATNSATYLPWLQVDLCTIASADAPCGAVVSGSLATAANGALRLAADGKAYSASLALKSLGLSPSQDYRLRVRLVDAGGAEMQVGYQNIDVSGGARGASRPSFYVTNAKQNLPVKFVVGPGIPRALTLTMSGGGAQLNPSDTRTLTLALTGWDGASLPVDGASWTSTSSAVSVNGSGATATITAVSPTTEPVTIAASVAGLTASVQVTVAAAVQSVTVLPATLTLGAGTTAQLSVQVLGPGGPITGRPVAWSSSAPSLVTVDQTGKVSALAPTTTPVTVTATVDGVQGSAAVSVTPAIARMWLGASYLPLPQGSVVGPISVSLADAAGLPISVGGKVITWSSSNPSVAPVAPGGVITAASPGWAIVSASCEGRVASAAVIVTPLGGNPSLTVGSVIVVPFQSTVNRGDSLQLFAIPLDGSGRALDIAGGRSWISGSSAARVNEDGYVVGLPAADTHTSVTITASISGVNGNGYVDVVNPPPPQPPATGTIVITPSTVTLDIGNTVTFSAAVYDGAGNVVPNPSLVWNSGNNGVATVEGFSGLTASVKAVGGGTAQITASTGALHGHAVVQVTPPVVPPPVGTIVISAPGLTPDADGVYHMPVSSGSITLTAQLVLPDGSLGTLPSLGWTSGSNVAWFTDPSQPLMSWSNTGFAAKRSTITVSGSGYTGSRVFEFPNP